ncbi:carotene epsilon-monooxygenase, chloroplastic-like [Capsicum annuum]|uniref:carotene epsilon-monooxygenase, chloroplastic-like n=1 Tax=Capsicum annuum TaxID=4072 RepID=UPI001FB0FB28|nr:carotene epsilon-monooxygenase, chloroplastic-like [Capsicum annuum]
MVEKLLPDAISGSALNMEAKFSQLALDIKALCKIIPRQIKAENAVSVIRHTVEELIAKCKEIYPSALEKAHEEVDRVLGGRSPTYEDMKNLKFLTQCIIESLRLYPHPPVLIRRAQVADVLPGNYKVNAGRDIMISVYNIHHSSEDQCGDQI